MKTETLLLAALTGLASASPLRQGSHPRGLHRREVPQEHSHEFVLTITREFLNLNNPKNIADPVFGLLGNAAAAAGAGAVTNLDCLHQETADQAFTNAKAAGDLRGMAGALMFQALERNTGGVGVKSAACTETPVNPEIGAFAQHQDPASDGASEGNRQVTLELARQLAAIGADPLLALETGTFAPGDKNDATGKGNSCDTTPDEVGCIFTQRLLVLDATPDEIAAAVANVTPTFTGTGGISATHIDFNGLPVAGATGVVTTSAAAAPSVAVTSSSGADAITTTSAADSVATSACEVPAAAAPVATSSCTTITTTMSAAAPSNTAGNAVDANPGATPAGTNVQAFTGTLGGPPPPVISTSGDRPFSVNGNTFAGQGAAIQRSCAIQHNACANAANSGQIPESVVACDAQETACKAFNNLRRRNLMLGEVRAAKVEAAARLRRRQAAGDFGTCSDLSIVFKDGLDGRTQPAFVPNNKADFDHGSALNIGVIAGFICQRLNDSCKAPAAVVVSCASASAAAVATTQDQSAADAFNQGLGLGSGVGVATPTPTRAAAGATGTATATEDAVVMTITQCS